MSDIPWYHAGLRFKCTECGQCCTGSPGYVWLTVEEARQIAELLQMPEKDFIQKYTRRIGNRLSLKEDSKTFDCVFLQGKKCEIYLKRPEQCRTFPWWVENLKSRKAWEEEGARCEGINHPDGEIISLKTIQKNLGKEDV
ncbi:MAG: YkgJ family cysteine cluster protein [Chlamydiales bacterium]|nr:YkgJ family cysteine cluster protein [Chlamydiales bacterium]